MNAWNALAWFYFVAAIVVGSFALVSCVTTSDYCAQWFAVGSRDHYECVARTDAQRVAGMRAAAKTYKEMEPNAPQRVYLAPAE